MHPFIERACLAIRGVLSLSILFSGALGAEASGAPRIIQDCETCPPMVVVPAGSFVMGSTAEERAREKVPKPPKVPFDFARFEQPQHTVKFTRPFAIGRYEVSRGEYARFVAETGHPTGPSCWAWDAKSNNYAEMAGWVVQQGKSWKDPGFPQTDEHPVVCVDFADARAFARWLSGKTGQTYRLPTESEWEYAARAGSSTTRSWGNDIATAELRRLHALQVRRRHRVHRALRQFRAQWFRCVQHAGQCGGVDRRLLSRHL
jgi:formylglycine-generating enzyme